MKDNQLHILQISQLSEGEHYFDFELGDKFFAQFEHSLLQKGHFQVNLKVRKSETMLQLDFTINGKAELTCDRCLEVFQEPLEVSRPLILKFGAEQDVINEEIEMISWKTTELNLNHYLYEFISLSLPMKKLHPKFRQTDVFDNNSEGEVIYSSSTDNDNQKLQENQDSDPRWEALRKLKNN